MPLFPESEEQCRQVVQELLRCMMNEMNGPICIPGHGLQIPRDAFPRWVRVDWEEYRQILIQGTALRACHLGGPLMGRWGTGENPDKPGEKYGEYAGNMRKPTVSQIKHAGTGRVDQHDFSKKGAELKDLSLHFIVMFHMAAKLAGIPNQVQKIVCKNEKGKPAELYVVEFEEIDPNLEVRYHGTHLGCLCCLVAQKMQLMEPGDDDWTG